jgi:hypothetical protein
MHQGSFAQCVYVELLSCVAPQLSKIGHVWPTIKPSIYFKCLRALLSRFGVEQKQVAKQPKHMHARRHRSTGASDKEHPKQQCSQPQAAGSQKNISLSPPPLVSRGAAFSRLSPLPLVSLGARFSRLSPLPLVSRGAAFSRLSPLPLVSLEASFLVYHRSRW